jgi:hypothetical protein
MLSWSTAFHSRGAWQQSQPQFRGEQVEVLLNWVGSITESCLEEM